MGAKHNKCCCGASSCLIGSDDFERADENPVTGDWAEISGDWEVASNQLNSVSEGLLITKLRQVAPVDGTAYTYRFYFTVHGSGPWKIICKFTDSTNFDWIELLDIGTDEYAPKFWRRTGGVDSLVLDPANYPAGPLLALTTVQGASFSICYSSVDWSISGPGEFRWSSCEGSPATALPASPYGFVGFLSGTFDNFVYDIHWESNHDCYYCGCFCSDGVGGSDYKCIPEELTLTLTPVVNHTECTSSPPSYTFTLLQSFPLTTPDPPPATYDEHPEKKFWFSNTKGPFVDAGPDYIWFRLECLGFGDFELHILQYPSGASDPIQLLASTLIKFTSILGPTDGARPTAVECTPIVLTFPNLQKILLQIGSGGPYWCEWEAKEYSVVITE